MFYWFICWFVVGVASWCWLIVLIVWYIFVHLIEVAVVVEILFFEESVEMSLLVGVALAVWKGWLWLWGVVVGCLWEVVVGWLWVLRWFWILIYVISVFVEISILVFFVCWLCCFFDVLIGRGVSAVVGLMIFSFDHSWFVIYLLIDSLWLLRKVI